jgi:hypothetical protein
MEMMVTTSAVFRESQGPRGIEKGRIMALSLMGQRTCACCDTPMTVTEKMSAPQMYEDGLCSRCFEWVGRVLTAWMGSDNSVAQSGDEGGRLETLDPFWIDASQIRE